MVLLVFSPSKFLFRLLVAFLRKEIEVILLIEFMYAQLIDSY